jgi:hypothetical protein
MEVFVRDRYTGKFFQNTWSILRKRRYNILLRNLFKDKHSTPTEQGIIYGEAWIFCRSSDQDNRSLFHKRKQDILLRLIPTVDFIEKYDRLFPILMIEFCLIYKFS